MFFKLILELIGPWLKFVLCVRLSLLLSSISRFAQSFSSLPKEAAYLEIVPVQLSLMQTPDFIIRKMQFRISAWLPKLDAIITPYLLNSKNPQFCTIKRSWNRVSPSWTRSDSGIFGTCFCGQTPEFLLLDLLLFTQTPVTERVNLQFWIWADVFSTQRPIFRLSKKWQLWMFISCTEWQLIKIPPENPLL